ncbi:MAG: serine--tRNA ligase [Chloroflexi bacterium]|nr:serine--tRNA ligase [Chloroflexota bacterium]
MLPAQTIRERTADVRRSLEVRRTEAPIDRILELDERRRALLTEVESMRADRNRAGRAIGAARDAAKRARLIEEQRAVAGRLDALEGLLREVDAELDALLLQVPNLPHPDVPVGGEADSVVVLEGDGAGERRLDPPQPTSAYPAPATDEARLPHWELGERLGIIDFERGVKISGSQFYVLRGDGARLQRALIAWMLDLHREQGYVEVYPPAVIKEEMLVGTGQLPKFAHTMFHLEGTDLWLNPTAEVPVTNLYRDEILDVGDLPILHTAYTPCFRNEQFSAGAAVRGIKRGYQFDKVEMVRFENDESSWAALEQLLDDALEVARRLGLRYRVLRLATADLTFASAMTYDIEVWAPGAREWLEVSSVSNFEAFQARRANLRYRDPDGRIHALHTLNGSGLALPRTVATLLETHQLEDGSVELPEALRLYLGGQASISPQTRGPRRWGP